jgi:hypothetical protein
MEPSFERDDVAATPTKDATPYPAGLLDWAGHRGGGVRRLFDKNSGRPGEAIFETNLLHRLRGWTKEIANQSTTAPRVVLLVGGPGNGKTEAVETTIAELDQALGAGGQVGDTLKVAFHPPAGEPVPRLVTIDAGSVASPPRQLRLDVVQDASVGGRGGRSAAMALVDELEAAAADASPRAYLCCVNRGVLDDAMIHAIDAGLAQSRDLLEAVARAVSLAPDAPACWPLDGFPQVAVWPMDAESLIEDTVHGDTAPASAILERAINETRWPAAGVCAAGPSCPFCASRKLLASSRESGSLLRMLRWFELGTSKRWTFRDLFSLTSYLLAGSGMGTKGAAADPCQWAADLVEADKGRGRPRRESSAAVFNLVAAQYQHALFHRWDRTVAASLLKDIKELGLQDADHTAMGLHFFLQSRSGGYVPATIAPLLEDLVELLDPAMASPDSVVALYGGPVTLGDFDIRFSRSVREGLDYAVKARALNANEKLLLERLAELDELLATPRLRRKRPTSATRIQRLARDFACRVTRRSVGARHGLVPDAVTLEAFQRVVADADGQGHDLREIAIQVEDLLNNGDNFDVSLTTTFGQPMPPARSRAILVVPRRRVYPREIFSEGRPRPSVCFLDVEVGSSPQPIAVTYDLFKAVVDLERGLSPASLPRSVLALLDTTRARIAGSIVRDRHVRERPTILLGEGLLVERHRGQFAATKRGRRR